MIYLTVPIAHPDPAIVKFRVDVATRTAALLYEAGVPVFSPATHGYGFAILAPQFPPPGMEWDYWSKIDLPILTRCCSLLAVIALPGVDKSTSVAAEKRAASKIGIPLYTLTRCVCGKLLIECVDTGHVTVPLVANLLISYRQRFASGTAAS